MNRQERLLTSSNTDPGLESRAGSPPVLMRTLFVTLVKNYKEDFI